MASEVINFAWRNPPISNSNGTVGVLFTAVFAYDGSYFLTNPPVISIVSGTLPPGLSFSHVTGGEYRISGTPTQAGSFTFGVKGVAPLGTIHTATTTATIIIAAGSTPTPAPAPGTLPGATTPPAISALPLTWFQARSLALNGYRIRRAGWADRYLEYVSSLWFMQRFNATTKVAGARTVVQAADWASVDFRGIDWTTLGISGQTVPDAAISSALTIQQKYP